MSKSELELQDELEIIESTLKENRNVVNRIRIDLLNAETVLIGNKLYREKIVEELRRLRLNRQDV